MCGIRRIQFVLMYLIFFVKIIISQSEYRERWLTDGQRQPCEWEGVDGTCVNFWECDTNALDAVNGKHPPVCSIKNGEVYSCCTACQLVSNISDYIVLVDYGTIERKTGKKSIDKCLEYKSRYKHPCLNKEDKRTLEKQLSGNCYLHILKTQGIESASGGRDAEREEYPHMALLGYGEELESAEWLCGGSIISEQYILTAAHCGYADRLGAVKYVAVGILKRSDPREMWDVYRVDRFIPHPEYAAPSNYHDIALIYTDRRIRMSGSVVPACLQRGDETTDVAHATGWGATGHRAKLADVLQTVRVSRYNGTRCAERYVPQARRLSHGYNHTTQMCYGDSDVGRDTCQGDSGGPLQLDSCPHVIIGVTSSGHPCGFPDSPGLYTRVAHYVPWIEDIVWP